MRSQRWVEGEVRPEVGAGNRSSAAEPKSLRQLHGHGREDQGVPELGALIPRKHAGLQGWAGMVKALMAPLMCSPRAPCLLGGVEPTSRIETLPNAGDAAPTTSARGNGLEGTQPRTRLGETLYLTRVTTATLPQRQIPCGSTGHNYLWAHGELAETTS